MTDQTKNQCDGCRRGLPVDDDGIHVGPGGFWSGDMMVCTAGRYVDDEPCFACRGTGNHYGIQRYGEVGYCPCRFCNGSGKHHELSTIPGIREALSKL